MHIFTSWPLFGDWLPIEPYSSLKKFTLMKHTSCSAGIKCSFLLWMQGTFCICPAIFSLAFTYLTRQQWHTMSSSIPTSAGIDTVLWFFKLLYGPIWYNKHTTIYSWMPMDKDPPLGKTAEPKVSELKIAMSVVRAKNENLKERHVIRGLFLLFWQLFELI